MEKITLWMSASCFMFLSFMCWSIPLTTDDKVFAFCWTFFTFIALVMIQRWSWKLLITELDKEDKKDYFYKMTKFIELNWFELFKPCGFSLTLRWPIHHRLIEWIVLQTHEHKKCKHWRASSIITWHSLGNSLTAFSTAKLREALFFEISTRQFGHVATWSRNRPSANKWVKHPAHIRWPITH